MCCKLVSLKAKEAAFAISINILQAMNMKYMDKLFMVPVAFLPTDSTRLMTL